MTENFTNSDATSRGLMARAISWSGGFGLLLLFVTLFSLTTGAQTTVTVNQTNLQNWLFYNDENDTIDNNLGSFVYGPATAPLGTGGVQISVSGTQRRNLATYQFSGTVLANITTLRYSTYNPSAGNGGSANRSGYLQFNVDFNGSDTWQRRLVYLPSDNGAVVQNTWQEWDAINSGNAIWRYSGGTFPGGGTTKTWSQILADYPGVRIRVTDAFVGIRVGEPYADGYTENIDAFKFGTSSGTTFFNFDPAPATLVVDDNATECPTAGFSTIQSAANAANPGDIIQVCAGTYPEYVTTNKNLTFLGPQAGVDARTGRTTPANEAIVGTVNGAFNLQVTPGTTTVDGFTMSGATAVGDTPALLLLGGTGHQIVNNIVEGNSRGVYFGATNTSFRRNRLNNTGDGIFGNADNTTIEDNLFSGGHSNGAVNSTISTGDPQPDNYTLRNNVSLASGNFAVIFATNNGLISGNTVTNASFSAIFIGGGNSNLVIEGNSVTGGASNAVSFSGGFGYPADAGISIRSNTLSNNLRGVNLGAAAGTTTGIVIGYNRIVGNSSSGINNGSTATVNAENNWWGCNYGPGATGAGCVGTTNSVIGTVDANPWLTLTSTASPSAISTGGSSTVTSSLKVNSDAVNTVAGVVPDGISSAFAGVLGTVSPTTGATLAGLTSTVFTAGVAAGSGGGTTTIDGQTVTAPIAISFTCNNVSIPSGIEALRNTQVMVPLIVDSVSGRSIIAFDFAVTYNSAVMTYLGTNQVGTLSNGMTITVNSTTPGVLIISGFGTSPLAGSGSLIDLRFFANGAVGSTSAVNFTNFVFNEGVPCVNRTNGSVNIVSGDITGTVTYANALSSTPVPYTTLNGAGSVPVTGQSDLTGAYTLSGFGSGAYTVTPSKTGDVNGITSFDSARIAQHVVSLISLNATQLLAADVSNNGTVSSFDAAQIAQYVVSIPNASITGTWKFLPVNRLYANVETNQANQDYSAILMGEVSGNWVPPTTFGAIVPEVTLRYEDRVSVTLARVAAAPDSVLMIPVTVSDTTGKDIISYQFDVVFNPKAIRPETALVELSESLSAGRTATFNVIGRDRVRVAVFGAIALEGKGTLLNLRFKAVGRVNSASELRFENFLLNENPQLANPADGEFKVVGGDEKGSSIEGHLLSATGEIVGAAAAVVMIGSDGNQRSVRADESGYFVFRGVTPGETYTISVSSKGAMFAPLSVNAADGITTFNLRAVE